MKMSFVKRIYFSPLGYLITIVQKLLSPFVPRMMVYGYYNRIRGKFFRGTRISSSVFISSHSKLDIGDNVWISHYVRIDAPGGVKIGDGCMIGYNSKILSHSNHIAIRLNGTEFIKKSDSPERIGYVIKPVEIGEYTFVATGSVILPGVKIGKGCVIGVNSVVTRDIPDYSIAVGAPARIIGSTIDTDKEYFDDPIVKRDYYDKSLLKKFDEGRL